MASWWRVVMIASSPSRRRQCRYGATCYQRNPAHKALFAHPGDGDWIVRLDLGEEEDEHVRDQWCWIGVQGGSARTDGVLRFAALYLWVVLGWIYAAFVFVDVTRTLHQRAASVSLGQRETAMAMAQEATQQLRALVGIFIAVWAGGLVARGYEATVGEESFALTLWQCATLPLAGVLNAATLLLPQYLRPAAARAAQARRPGRAFGPAGKS